MSKAIATMHDSGGDQLQAGLDQTLPEQHGCSKIEVTVVLAYDQIACRAGVDRKEIDVFSPACLRLRQQLPRRLHTEASNSKVAQADQAPEPCGRLTQHRPGKQVHVTADGFCQLDCVSIQRSAPANRPAIMLPAGGATRRTWVRAVCTPVLLDNGVTGSLGGAPAGPFAGFSA